MLYLTHLLFRCIGISFCSAFEGVLLTCSVGFMATDAGAGAVVGLLVMGAASGAALFTVGVAGVTSGAVLFTVGAVGAVEEEAW